MTGGASGIGLALGRVFAEAGMQVMLADIETEALAAAVKSLHNFGPDVRGVTCDVSDASSVERAAAASFEAFGNVHVVCNNAGVAGGSGIDDISLDDWPQPDGRAPRRARPPAAYSRPRRRWPLRQHRPPWRAWSAVSGSARTRRASSPSPPCQGISLYISKPLGIDVTVLCPGWVRTRINEGERNRSERYGSGRVPQPRRWGGEIAAHVAERVQSGLDPSHVAARVLSAIRAGELSVFTHPEIRVAAEERFAEIIAAMDKAGR